jgi:hypothetical protein
MRHTNAPLALAALSLLGTGLAAPCQAQDARARDDRNGVFRMEILNGTTRTIHYFGDSLSPGEAATMREAAAIENERAYLDDLSALKRQYVLSERLLEPVRRDVQRSLYGLDVTRTTFATDYGWGGLGFGGYTAAVAPGFNTYQYNPWAYPYYGTGFATPVAGTTVQVNRSLANGVGDEGRMKEALARVVAQQATPEYVASLERAFDRVARRASASPSLRVALGLPTADEARRDRVRAAGAEEDRGVTLTLKGGDKVRGEKLQETKDWFILTREGGREVRVRAGEVVRVETTKKGGIAPAVGK